MKRLLLCIALLAAVCSAGPVFAQGITVKPGETLQQTAEAQKGKRVTVRLQSGEEMTGVVKNVTKELLHLSELTGKEFYDAVIDLNKVSAIIIRAK